MLTAMPNGQVVRLIIKHGCGRTIKVCDGAALTQAVQELAADPALCRAMGARARRTFETEFDKPIDIAQWEAAKRDAGTTGNPYLADEALERSSVSARNAR